MSTKKDKVNIKDLTIDELKSTILELGEPRHRTTQILQWLYKKAAEDFQEMSNIPKSLRKRLQETFKISNLREIDVTGSSSDGSSKHLLACEDGELIETVLMDSAGHKTICISSQVGCSLGCRFCRTGTGGLVRNLTSAEILDQVLYFKTRYLEERKRFNIVMMGMGEPFLNLKNVTRALEILNHNDAFALGEKRITLSTIGFPGKILELVDTPLKFGLAISLNAADDSVRMELMPAAGPIDEILSAGEEFASRRGTRVTLEYILIKGVNDSPADAKRLAALTSRRPFKINLIPFNEWEGCEFSRPGEDRIDRFISELLPTAPAVTVRRSQGLDIGAACGQLRARRLAT